MPPGFIFKRVALSSDACYVRFNDFSAAGKNLLVRYYGPYADTLAVHQAALLELLALCGVSKPLVIRTLWASKDHPPGKVEIRSTEAAVFLNWWHKTLPAYGRDEAITVSPRKALRDTRRMFNKLVWQLLWREKLWPQIYPPLSQRMIMAQEGNALLLAVNYLLLPGIFMFAVGYEEFFSETHWTALVALYWLKSGSWYFLTNNFFLNLGKLSSQKLQKNPEDADLLKARPFGFSFREHPLRATAAWLLLPPVELEIFGRLLLWRLRYLRQPLFKMGV